MPIDHKTQLRQFSANFDGTDRNGLLSAAEHIETLEAQVKSLSAALVQEREAKKLWRDEWRLVAAQLEKHHEHEDWCDLKGDPETGRECSCELAERLGVSEPTA